MPTTAAVIARLLSGAGIDRVFGLPGGEVLVLIDELRRAGVEFVLMRHEANAGIAAAVYGKLRGQPGVVLSTLGPGAANLMLPLSSAYLDQEPLLAISAQIPEEFPASHTHQRLPLHDVYRPVTKYVATLTAQNVADAVPRALAACMERPYGAAYVTLSAREALKAADNVPPAASVRVPAADRSAASAAAARVLAGKLSRAQRPLIVVGLGIDPANAAPLRAWLDAWNLPVAVTPKVKGIVDETAANFVGVAGGMAADDVVCGALQAADVLVGLGLDPVEVDKTWHAELTIDWVLDAPNVGGAAGIVPQGVALVDHAAFLEAIGSMPPPLAWDTPFDAFQQRRRRLLRDRSGAGGVMWPGDIVQSLADALPPDTIVTTDVGSHKYLFGQYWPSRHPATFWMSNGLSGMSYGLSAAIGARLARPDATVLAAVGDGGFSMNAQELESAERVGAPFITVVLEDGSYSLIKLSQEGRALPPYGVDFGAIDIVAMAASCGVEALRTAKPDELASAAAGAAGARRSMVIAVPVDYADYRRMF
ncbi:MAG TPA: thiamine pyrophosphate-binding protein [Vicinamibacterales bacterium]|nr:thiamine pyrophosphate-binding protein [Vicinamibacterales bacterium]